MPVLRITARLGGPVVVRDALHLDGILAAVHPDCVGGALHRASDASEVIRPPLPIVVRRFEDDPVHLASAEEWPEDARRRSGHLTRRRDPDDLDHLTRPIQTASGPDRDVMLRFPVVEAATVSWVAVGDRSGVVSLLKRVPAIGSIRRHGYGVVLGWDVEVVRGADPASVLVSRGVARRHLPASWCEAPQAVTVGAWRAPYWHPSSIGARVTRGTPTGLREGTTRVLEGVR